MYNTGMMRGYYRSIGLNRAAVDEASARDALRVACPICPANPGQSCESEFPHFELPIPHGRRLDYGAARAFARLGSAEKAAAAGALPEVAR